MSSRESSQSLVLVVIVGTRGCAIPIHHVAETMRPLPIVPVAGMPLFILGLSVIRGAPLPVVDMARLLGGGERGSAPGRFVSIKIGERRVALAVDEVIGVRRLDTAALGELPPLLQGAGAGLIEALGMADERLLVVLRAARLVPEQVWTVLAAGAEAR